MSERKPARRVRDLSSLKATAGRPSTARHAALSWLVDNRPRLIGLDFNTTTLDEQLAELAGMLEPNAPR